MSDKKEKKYYRRACQNCNYFCVFELVEEGGQAHELCTHCQQKTPISMDFADAHIQQCENWLANQGRMFAKLRPRIEKLAHPGDYVDLFGTQDKEKK